MLQFVLSLFLISEASEKNGSSQSVKISDDTLVAGVEKMFGECLDIADAVGDFMSEFEAPQKTRRRGEKDDTLAGGVTKKLKACREILEVVTTFRQRDFQGHIPWPQGRISLRDDELRFLNKQLKTASKKLGNVLFVASKHGDSSSRFHSACDGKGSTVVIVESTTGAVFGGYMDVSWSSSGGYGHSYKAFLFRLRPNMQRYNIKKGKEAYALYRTSGYGPTFGNGHDLVIAGGALGSTSSYTNGGNGYNIYAQYQLTDGAKNFKVYDYVVFQALSL